MNPTDEILVSYLGPKNTYSQEAAKILAPSADLIPQASWEAIVRSVEDGTTSAGVLPYYNFLEGLVQETLDKIYEKRLTIIGITRLPIILAIGEHKENINRSVVYSHPKALGQSSEWLWQNFPNAKQSAYSSTSAAAELVSKEKSGLAIANTIALEEHGLDIIAKDIGKRRNGRRNFTDFYLVAKENGITKDKEKEYLTMVAVTPHVDEVGLLAQILTQVAYHGLNNAKIHSRPALDPVNIDSTEPQMFYLEIASHHEDANFSRCMDSLRYKLTPRKKDVEVVRVLGSYEKPHPLK